MSALALLAPARFSAAQVSVEVSPLRVELQAGPGSTSTQAVTLNNAGTEPIRVRARLTDWTLARDGSPQFEGTPEGGPYSATAWVRIAPPEQVLDPGKEGTVRFSLSVPADVSPAGYRTSILFEFHPASAPPGAAARSSSAAGSPRSSTSTSGRRRSASSSPTCASARLRTRRR